MKKGFLINPQLKTIEEIIINGNENEVLNILKTEKFDKCRPIGFKNDDLLYLDDYYFYREGEKYYFNLEGYPFSELPGPAVIAAFSYGESKPLTMSKKELESKISWGQSLTFNL